MRWDAVGVILGVVGITFGVGAWYQSDKHINKNLNEEIEKIKSSYALKSELPSPQDLSTYALKTDLSKISDLVNRIEVDMADQGVLEGTVAFFNGDCPKSGWSEFAAARGRYVVAANSINSVTETVGIKLEDMENRAAGPHTHQFTDSFVGGSGRATAASGNNYARPTSTKPTDPNEGVKGTNAPYIMLRACEKIE